MFQSLWNFAKRHRRKLIATGVLAGGAYAAWKVLLPKLQEMLLQRLLAPEGLNELLELAAKGEGGEKKSDGKATKRARFEHKQQVADAHVRKKLAALRARHHGCFKVEECTKNLQEAKAKNDGKAQAFQAFLVECLSRVASALYTLHVLLLLHRVEFNIVGREISNAGKGEEDEAAGIYTTFLESIDHLGDAGLQRIADAIRKSVKSALEAGKLQPQSAVTEATLKQLLIDACRAADLELLAQSCGAATLLPESLDKALLARGLAEAPQKEAARLLDEARDYVESPQFLAVFQASVAGAVKRLIGSMGPDGTAAGSPLADGASCPLAKLCGRLIALSNVLLDDEGTVAYVTGFAEEPTVGEFCEMLFYQEEAAAGK